MVEDGGLASVHVLDGRVSLSLVWLAVQDGRIRDEAEGFLFISKAKQWLWKLGSE